MSGTFVSGVKFSRAKPNSTLIGEPPARWDGAGVARLPTASYARAAGRFIGGSC
jgi:hypothetical protein